MKINAFMGDSDIQAPSGIQTFICISLGNDNQLFIETSNVLDFHLSNTCTSLHFVKNEWCTKHICFDAFL